MKDLSRQGLAHEQVYDALHAKDGTKNIKFRYDLIRNGVKHSEVDVLSASVSFDRFADINRTARFDIVGDSVDWLNDFIKPHLLLKVQVQFTSEAVNWGYIRRRKLTKQAIHDLRLCWAAIRAKKYVIEDVHRWVEFPLGVFIPSTPTQNSESGLSIYSVEAYDKTIVLKEDCLTARLFIPKGTNYIEAVKSIMISANATDIIGDSSDTLLPTDREFEIGESKLTIINKLLSEINFNPVYANADGVYMLGRYVEPSSSNISYNYQDNEYSVLYSDTQREADFYNVPNIFIAIVSNPELKTDMQSVYINDSPANKLSTVNRKRNIVSEIYRPDVMSSQADLDEYIKKIAFDKSQVYEKLIFTTDLMPIHERGEILEIRNGDVSGIYNETSWSMELSASGVMQHEARRLVAI